MADYATGYKRLDNNLRIRCQIFYTCAEYLQPEKADPRTLVQMQTSGTLRDFVDQRLRSYVKLREVSLSYEAPESFAAQRRSEAGRLHAVRPEPAHRGRRIPGSIRRASSCPAAP